MICTDTMLVLDAMIIRATQKHTKIGGNMICFECPKLSKKVVYLCKETDRDVSFIYSPDKQPDWCPLASKK